MYIYVALRQAGCGWVGVVGGGGGGEHTKLHTDKLDLLFTKILLLYILNYMIIIIMALVLLLDGRGARLIRV